jgi:hypothetical protein
MTKCLYVHNTDVDNFNEFEENNTWTHFLYYQATINK